jgi:hypothetical protein
MARVKNTKLRTVHDRWWRSERFKMGVVMAVGCAIGVALGILDPNGVG